MLIHILRGLLGLAVLMGIAWAMSYDRKRVPWRVIAWGIGLQLLLAMVVLGTGVGEQWLKSAAYGVANFVQVNGFGARMIFGSLADPAQPTGFIFAFAATGLLVIIFFSALMAVLYHVGVMQTLIWAMARVMMVTMGVSGAEAMAMAANVFVGQTEAPLVVRPYIEKMTNSEMLAMMTGGFATVAGSVLLVYMNLLGPDIGPHLLTASVLSAPAAFVMAKIMLPESQEAVTGGYVKLRIERTAHNLIEAAANGTQDGLKLYLNVVAMLLAFTALVKLIDWPLGAIGHAWLDMADGELSLAWLMGWALAPVAWCVGVEGWHDSRLYGGLVGLKLATNEFIAFAQMQSYIDPQDTVGFAHPRSAKMAAYALCGFANFASIGIQIGGITPLAPSRKTDLSRLAIRAMLGGALASSCTAAVAGMFLR